MKNIFIASTSTVHGKGYLEYALPALKDFFKGVTEILFVPYARPGGISHDVYTKKASEAFSLIGIKIKGIHEFENPSDAVKKATGIFIGGGNTFLLVSQLYKNELIDVIKEVVSQGTPYLGTSAGSVVTGLSMQNTNDMPIIYPPSFSTLGLLSFNVNAHYLDPDPSSKHMGETRATRINEFHFVENIPVLGLREGSWLLVQNDKIILKGGLSARLFLQGKEAQEFPDATDFSFL
ncbi:MAG: dipeptidase PepE [Flavobacteriaceae bacterium]|nr:MAG: dipeptidase PepE [Flavobacteriaceae bacterium]